MKGFLLVDAVPEGVPAVGVWLKGRAEVRQLHAVRYGHFNYLAEIEAPSSTAVQMFIANTVRYHRGVEQVRQVDEEQIPSILASEERHQRF